MRQSIIIKVGREQQKVNLDNLNYLESRGNYVQLHLDNERLLTTNTLINFDNRLKDAGFLRIHKSYIVNIDKVQSLQGNKILIGEKILPIGYSYKQMVLNKLG